MLAGCSGEVALGVSHLVADDDTSVQHFVVATAFTLVEVAWLASAESGRPAKRRRIDKARMDKARMDKARWLVAHFPVSSA